MIFEDLQTINQVDLLKLMMCFYYGNFKVNGAETPQLILFASSFAKNLLTTTSHLAELKIDLYEWEYLKFGDQKVLRIQPVCFSTRTTSKAQDRRS